MLLYLYDILVDLLKKADEYDLSKTILKYSNRESNWIELNMKEIEQKEDIELGAELMGRHILFSILRDICLYLYESLSRIERGKVTVAYTLARKPLQDNLYYLCWLLDNPKDLYQKINNQDPTNYDVSILKKDINNIIDMYNRILDKITKNMILTFEPF